MWHHRGVSGTAIALISLLLILSTGFVWFRRAMAVRLPENRSAFVAAMALSAVLGVLAFVVGVDWLGGVAAGVSIFLGSFLLFSVSISAQKGGSGAFHVGQPVPDFSAPNDAGDLFQLSSLAGKPLLLKFFRGHW